jgi:hypothetical protein
MIRRTRTELIETIERSRQIYGPLGWSFNDTLKMWRSLPMLQHDAERPEDLDTSAEDHVADEARYACMSRPWIAAKAAPTAKLRDAWDMTENAEADWRTV